jgi:hypothetical protein
MLTDAPVPESPGRAPRPERTWRIAMLLAAVVAALVAGAAITAAARDGGDHPRAGTDAGMADRAVSACRQWVDDTDRSDRDASSARCDEMGKWMAGEMAMGGPMGSAMWSTPEGMAASCVQALTGQLPPRTDAATWCRQMVEWMSSRAGGDWAGWMMGRSMMGRTMVGR